MMRCIENARLCDRLFLSAIVKCDRPLPLVAKADRPFQINSIRFCISDGSSTSQIKIKPRKISPSQRLFVTPDFGCNLPFQRR
ncbi:hypothetical protein QT972_30500 [Microcoleus sp. herbarium7]|uniref:hypothetical protein n=1 Tax=Microcoleus sp. herbarium7 TaxID=3055435 RepID=UPI002FD3F456